jgi:hypothetical protein
MLEIPVLYGTYLYRKSNCAPANRMFTPQPKDDGLADYNNCQINSWTLELQKLVEHKQKLIL